MPTSNSGAAMTNDSAQIATLSIRVTSMEGRVNELNAALNGVQATLSSKIDTLATSLGGKIEERGRTPWAIYLTGAMAFFSLYAYIDNSKIGPLKEKDNDLVAITKELTNTMRTDMVPARTHAREWAQNDERFQRLEERFKLIDDRIKSGEQSLIDRIRFGETAQVDRIKRIEDSYSNSYNLRDAIQQIDSRVQHFERMTIEKRAGQ